MPTLQTGVKNCCGVTQYTCITLCNKNIYTYICFNISMLTCLHTHNNKFTRNLSFTKKNVPLFCWFRKEKTRKNIFWVFHEFKCVFLMGFDVNVYVSIQPTSCKRINVLFVAINEVIVFYSLPLLWHTNNVFSFNVCKYIEM